MKTQHLVVVGVALLVASSCARTAPRRWSGESKNSAAQLTAKQQFVLNEKLPFLNHSAASVLVTMQSLAVLLNHSGPLDKPHAESMALKLGNAMLSLLRADPQLEKLTFMTGEYLHPVTVSHEHRRFQVRTDLDVTVEGLRDQIGFFPEDLSSTIVDLQGYPSPQFAVATSGTKRLLIRIPVIAEGHYVGDLTAEYLIE